MSRSRSAPPEIPGFEIIRSIGGGGFADVFLYRQLRPRREVAIKVLRSEHLSEASLEQFAQEADVMAGVSAHPFIVTVYLSDVAADGRPFIVMEHYPGPHFGERARGGQIPVAEALRVGIEISAAVETAHQGGVLHRDIKPANILTSAFGRPGLTDFGLAAVQQAGEAHAVDGVTIAFAPAEVLQNDGSSGLVTSDVYGLAATLYALLAGRSPLWVPGGNNTDSALLQRGLTGAIPRLTREDVPASLANLVANALSPDPFQRPQGALALAQSLQAIEQELRLPRTTIEVRDDGTAPISQPRPVDDDDRTRRPARQVDPTGQVGYPAAAGHLGATSAPSYPPTGASFGAPYAGSPTPTPTVHRFDPTTGQPLSPPTDPSGPMHPSGPLPPPAGQGSARLTLPRRTDADDYRSRLPIFIGAGVAITLIVLVAITIGVMSQSGTSTTTTTLLAQDTSEIVTDVPEPPTDVSITMTANGTLTVSFLSENLTGNETYRLTFLDDSGKTMPLPDGEKTLEVDASPVTVAGFDPDEPVCVEIGTTIQGRVSMERSGPTCTTTTPS